MATIGSLTLYSNKGGSSFSTVNSYYVGRTSSSYRIYYKIPITYNNDHITGLTIKTSIYVTASGGTQSNTINARLYSDESLAQSYSDTYLSAATGDITSFNVSAKIITFNFSGLNLTSNNLYVSFVTTEPSTNLLEISNSNASASVTTALNTYTVSATRGTGISSVSGTGTKTHGSSVTLTATPSTGYHFTNWTYGSSTYTPNPWTITSSITSNISVTANAAINSGTVYYYANGGTSTSGYSQDSSGKSNTTSSVTYASTAANLYNVTTLFTRTGYHIAFDVTAWRYGSATSTTYFNQASQDFSSYLDSASEHGSSFNLYANWVANTYTINYNANSGTGSTAATSCTYDSSATIASNGFTRTGYKFIGWNTAADGTGTTYSEGDSVTNLTSTNGGSITLYAQWEALATMFVKVDGAYKAGIPYVKVDGDWKRATAVYIKVNGEWKHSIV